MCCGSGRQERLWSVSWKDSLRAAPELQSVEAGEGGPSLGLLGWLVVAGAQQASTVRRVAAG